MRHRSLIRVTTAVALTVMLAAACSPADPEPASGDETRTVDDQFGTVTFTGTPERVVASGNTESDIAIALGVTPVAMGQWYDEDDGSSPWRREMLDGEQPEIIGYNPDGYDVEETLAFEPDLVLGGFDLEEEPYRQLSAVAPTLSMPYSATGDELTRAVGVALNREAEAEDLIERTQAMVADAAEEFPELDGKTISVVSDGSPGTLVDMTGATLNLGMLEGLGLTGAPGVSDFAADDYTEVPAENWTVFDGDILVVAYYDEAVRAEVEASELFQRIPAVRNGHYLALTDRDDVELIRAAAPPWVQYALRILVPRLAEIAR
ncbi:ABC transporter substrate-binding protein [Aeromicrobium sp. YIM 150415]|uniref:ABC transporter substrate-binding protein n=1 Tax=Aeromicrobium sp. YIM 150415 TaxID=2803912 RepID=UPI001964E278|nr:ABC transporter substrate-binding protein [Aeromicrobium sp. YIM 150415]MBM9463789.1 ABC transporter substrate-binding protein [Aeromicrobium sp. YIM 150415]